MSRLTLLASTCFCLLLSLFTPTTFATPDPVPAPVNGDPCGPAIQDTPNYPNTCNVAPTLVESPQPYGINCTGTVSTSKEQLVWSNCSASLESICTKALDPRTRKGHWIWSNLAQGCALAFFPPPYQGSAVLQNYTRCTEIFTAMSDSCSSVVPASNLAGVNLRQYPGFPPPGSPDASGGNWIYYTGEAVNVGYPSYIISTNVLVNPFT